MTGSSPIRIFTLDDHPLVREGISGLVGVQPDMKAVVQAIDQLARLLRDLARP
jgi:DNA-binding NarL/FixJ family response regulator